MKRKQENSIVRRNRKHYDTAVTLLFILNREHILPEQFRNSTPLTTKNTWRNYAKEKFEGYEFRTALDEGIRNADLYAKYKRLKLAHRVVTEIYKAMSNLFYLIKFPVYKDKSNRELVLDLIQKYKSVIAIHSLLQIFKISKSTYQSWLLQIKVKCVASYFSLCVRRYGTQLTKQEVSIIENALNNPTYAHWPVVSIAYYFQRQGWLHASAGTWNKYKRLLGIKRMRFKKSKKIKGIESTHPNQYWHIDITHFKTNNGAKHCIYFLSDNFSRKILAWRVGHKVDWQLVRDCIEEAHKNVNELINLPQLQIVCDGGPENTHHKLDEFIKGLAGSVKKLVALKDIEFSNSPVEAVHRNFKMYYASEEKIEDTSALVKRVAFYVHDVNAVRPSNALKGFTPDEVYYSQKPNVDFRELRLQSAEARKLKNKNLVCEKCEFL